MEIPKSIQLIIIGVIILAIGGVLGSCFGGPCPTPFSLAVDFLGAFLILVGIIYGIYKIIKRK